MEHYIIYYLDVNEWFRRLLVNVTPEHIESVVAHLEEEGNTVVEYKSYD